MPWSNDPISNVFKKRNPIIFGTVIRTSNINSRELIKDFQCRLCGKRITCKSDISEYNNFQMPLRCDQLVEREPTPYADLLNALDRLNGSKPVPKRPKGNG